MELSESERIRFTLKQMQEIFPEIPEIGECFEGGISKLWDEDPWARGASSWSRLARESKTGRSYLMLWTQSNPTL